MVVKVDTVSNFLLDYMDIIAESYVIASQTDGLHTSYTGAINIPVEKIKAAPAILGESDVLKVLQKTPGVQTGVEGFAGMYVRGGGAEDNLQLYDGVPLYNINHLLGMLSLFSPDAVKDVTFYKGVFPAKYGGRVSSIVDVRTNDGNKDRFTGLLSVGIISSKVHFEGPLFNGNTTFSFSFRGMPTLFAGRILVNTTGYSYYFYDLNGKLSHRFSDSDRLTFVVYNGLDSYKSSKSDNDERTYYMSEYQQTITEKQIYTGTLSYRWGNTMASLRWNHVFSPKLFSDFNVSWTNYQSVKRDVSIQESTIEPVNHRKAFSSSVSSSSGIHDLNCGASFEYSMSKDNLITFGFQSIFHNFTPSYALLSAESVGASDGSDDFSYNNAYSDCLNGWENSVFCDDYLTMNEHLSMDLGVRATSFNTQNKSHLVIEPRLSAVYLFNNQLSTKIGYSKMSQYVHLLSSGMMSLPTDVWVPITNEIKPVISDIFSVGMYRSWDSGWNVSTECYRKRLHNVLEYKDGKASLFCADFAEVVSSGEGFCKGVEFMLEKKSGKTEGWVSYTLSKSDRWFPDGSVNNGKIFPYTYDRRHNVNVSIFHKFSDRIDLDASWTFYSGNMITLPMRVAMVYDKYSRLDIPYVQSRNNYRLPSTHHLDVSANFKKQRKNGVRVWSFGVYNVYGRKNPNLIEQYVDYYIKQEGDQNFQSRLVINKVTLLTMIPSANYSFSF